MEEMKAAGGPVSELIGRDKTTYQFSFYQSSFNATSDISERNYSFWDKLRVGKASELELAGALIKPLASKTASWVLGRIPGWQVDDGPLETELNDWWLEVHGDVLRAYEDSAGLGQSYLLINPDQSVTVLPPHVCRPIVNPENYGQVIGYRVREVFYEPTLNVKRQVIEDEYYADIRRRRVSNDSIAGEWVEFPNLIGRVPIVPIANNRGSNERFGSPEGYATIPILKRYNETLASGLDGNRHQGRPTPTIEFENVEEMESFWAWCEDNNLLEKVTTTIDDGREDHYYRFRFDADNLVLLGGAKFKYEQPGSFAGDTTALLEILFYLFLQHSEIPEFIWGNAISSSKASAESQMPAFIRWIEKKRAYARPWLIEVSKIALSFIRLATIGQDITPNIRWESLTTTDGTLTKDAVEWAYGSGLLTAKTALDLLPLDIDDPESEVNNATLERDEQRAAIDAQPAGTGEMNYRRFLEREAAAAEQAAAAA